MKWNEYSTISTVFFSSLWLVFGSSNVSFRIGIYLTRWQIPHWMDWTLNYPIYFQLLKGVKVHLVGAIKSFTLTWNCDAMHEKASYKRSSKHGKWLMSSFFSFRSSLRHRRTRVFECQWCSWSYRAELRIRKGGGIWIVWYGLVFCSLSLKMA